MVQRKFIAHPKSASGDFYVVNGECISCGAPHAVAPDLIGWVDEEKSHCIWKKQPETAGELEQALAAFDASDVQCYRYAGADRTIQERVGIDCCDNWTGARNSLKHPPILTSEFRLTMLDKPGPLRRIFERILGSKTKG